MCVVVGGSNRRGGVGGWTTLRLGLRLIYEWFNEPVSVPGLRCLLQSEGKVPPQQISALMFAERPAGAVLMQGRHL